MAVMTNGRHQHISVWQNVQAVKMISTIARAQCNLIFINKLDTLQARQAAQKAVMAGTVTMNSNAQPKEEELLYKKLYQKHASEVGDMLVIDNRPIEERANRSKKKLFWYRAPDVSEWEELPEPEEDSE